MRKFTKINEAKLKIQDETYNNISTAKLQAYLDVTSRFLSPAGKAVVEYLIAHPDYVNELGDGSDENPLQVFFTKASPRNEEEQELLQNIRQVSKSHKLMEIPVFQTKEQFDAVVSKEVALDEIVLDLESEAGRAAVIKQYTPLVHKICRKYYGKTNIPYEDILGFGFEGLVNAMNKYGKSGKEYYKDKDREEMPDAKKRKAVTFTNFAYMCIQFDALWALEHANTVHVPKSEQKRQKDAQGYISANQTISGDRVVGQRKEGGGNKADLHFINSYGDDADMKTNSEDIDVLWKDIYKDIEEKFDEDTYGIFYSYFGLNGYEKMKGKDIAKKFGVVPSAITYYIKKVINFLKNNPDTKEVMADLYSLYHECHDMEDNADTYGKTYSINDNFNVSVYDDQADDNNTLYKVNKWFEHQDKNYLADILLKSILEMDNEAECRNQINTLFNNTDETSKKYASVCKNFVNFVYDIIGESENIEYSDRIVKIARIMGKDRIMALFNKNKINESMSTNEKIDAIKELINQTKPEDKPFVILLKYYYNHYEDFEKDKNQLNDSEIKRTLKEGYEKLFDETPKTAFDGLQKILQIMLDNDIEFEQ